MAARPGFLHDASLASERFGDYLLQDLQENHRAGQYYQDSIRYYSEWGSDYKAESLQKKCCHLWAEGIPSEIVM